MDASVAVESATSPRRTFHKLTRGQLAIIRDALLREPPASAAAIAETLNLDVSSVHRIRRRLKAADGAPAPPLPPASPVVGMAGWWRHRRSW